jgi:hypothetical protein
MESDGKGHLRQQENCILRGEKGKFCGTNWTTHHFDAAANWIDGEISSILASQNTPGDPLIKRRIIGRPTTTIDNNLQQIRENNSRPLEIVGASPHPFAHKTRTEDARQDRPSHCTRRSPILISTKADLYITGSASLA